MEYDAEIFVFIFVHQLKTTVTFFGNGILKKRKTVLFSAEIKNNSIIPFIFHVAFNSVLQLS
jgi:hypothetical protein